MSLTEKIEEKETSWDLTTLPTRPRTSYQPKSREISLISNHFQLNLSEINDIYIYKIIMDPKIEGENRSLKDAIIESIRENITEEIGIYILSGYTLFSGKKPHFEESTSLETQLKDKQYKVTIKLVKIVPIDGFNSSEKKQTYAPMKFFNIVIKFFLKQLKFYEFGRSSKYYDPTKREKIAQTNLMIYHGFETSFNYYESGLFLRIDVSHKIVRTDTCLALINHIYEKNQSKSKDEKRLMVKEALLGKFILANYDDLLFDRACTTFSLDEDNEENSVTLSQYYKDKYGLIIKADKQPLILSTYAKTKKKVYLLPEFCVMTGIPEDFNDYQRKKVSDSCRKGAQDRMQILEDLSDKLRKDTHDPYMNPKKLCESLGIDLSNKAIRFKAKQLLPPKINFGNGEYIDDMRDSTFKFNSQVYSSYKKIAWAIIYFRDFNVDDLLRTLNTFSKNMRIEMKEPKHYNLGEYSRKAFGEIEHILLNKIKGKYDIVLIILPTAMKINYKKIKRICYCEVSVLSQIILQGTLERKGLPAICSKVLQQVATKVGAILWVAEPPKGLPSKTMLIGAEVLADKLDKTKHVVAFCATVDSKFSSYYSRVVFQKQGLELIEQIRSLVKDAITAYYKRNQCVPETILYLRDGVQENQINSLLQIEVQNFIHGFSDLSKEYKPNLAVIVIDKKVQHKFFRIEGQDKIMNPPFGTIVDTTLVSRFYDFFLISQNVGFGTVTPTHYRVVFDNTGIPEGKMQELIFGQCFNYMNWSGAIRVPAPVQYAHKLAQFVSQSLNEECKEDLRNHFYYL